ncbi:hypothetical protein M3Y98_00398300 [Aphelenchoides besseyi]|nr:hypothetical protein M3Y98_00398300 [Aphelenchoides besseyi]
MIVGNQEHTSNICEYFWVLAAPQVMLFQWEQKCEIAIFTFWAKYFHCCASAVYCSLHSRRPGNSYSKQCDRPCFNGGICTDGVCNCAPGWTGPQCDSCFNRVLKSNNTKGHFTDGPLNYSASSRCTWIIESDTNSSLVLYLTDFFTECCWDHLYVYDGDAVEDNLIAALSGNLSGTEVIARTGKAIVYFTSDLAFNLRGFNVSYEYGRCLYNCSNHGDCKASGECKCHDGYSGEFCETSVCTKKMFGSSGPCNRGTCGADNRCNCTSSRWHGDHCQQLTTMPVWDRVPLDSSDLSLFHPRASHQAVNVDGVVWIYGGYMLNSQNASDLVSFDLKKTKIKVNSDSIPPRYDHSMVYYQGSLYVFGGVVQQQHITNELWRFDLTNRTWSLESAPNRSALALPAAVSGHTAHVIKDEMYVIFGYNPFEGYLHRIQIYSFVTRSWISPDERGGTDTQVMGRFGHSSVLTFQEKKPYVFVYGGFNAPLNGYSYAITDDLMVYNPSTDLWTMLESSGAPRFRHSAVILDEFMIVFGGNSHNESTAQQIGCYSSNLLAYDTVCRNWVTIAINDILYLPRYGHCAVEATNDKNETLMYVFGGFSGIPRNDVLKLTPTAECNNQVYTEKECMEDANGIRCVLLGNRCQRVASNLSYRQPFTEFIKNDKPKFRTSCSGNGKRLIEEEPCTEIKDCLQCVERKRCGWCGNTHSCMSAGSSCLDDLSFDQRMCTQIAKLTENTRSERACGLANNCHACRRMAHCVWMSIGAKHVCVSKADQALIIEQYNRRHSERLLLNDLPSSSGQNSVSLLPSTTKLTSSASAVGTQSWSGLINDMRGFGVIGIMNGSAEYCADPCSAYNECYGCIRSQCMWCPTTARCVPMDTYMISFPYGQCQTWITAANTPHACQMDPLDCGLQKTATECQLVGPRCGWCDFGTTGLGRCVVGTVEGPSDPKQCVLAKNETWYYVGEPSCQCNGHSSCSTTPQTAGTAIQTLSAGGYQTLKCNKCENKTRGDHCEYCEQGYYGDPRNGGQCEQCECNDQANSCDSETGHCYCTTKGATGRHCESCEVKYYGDPKNGKPCTFELVIDFIFTFKLDSEDFKDKHVNQINFFSTPFKRDTDVQFSVTCEGDSDANVSIRLRSNVFEPHPGHNRLAELPCTSAGIKRTYSATEFDFGINTNTTFYVSIFDFKTPMKIQVSFAQSPPINWVLFFVIFAACFIVLLVVAGILLLIKQRIRNAGNEANVIIENERMAARPKATVQVDMPIVRQNTQPTAISVEPCRNYTTAIYTVVVRMPTGGRRYTPFGTSGLAVASSLCHLAHTHIALLEPPNANEKTTPHKSTLRRFIPFIR